MYGASKLMKTLNIQDALQINLHICKPKQEFSPDSNSYTITLNLFISLRILTLFKNYLRFFSRFYEVVCWAVESHDYNRSWIYVNTFIEFFSPLILRSEIKFAIDELPEKYPNPGPAIMSPSSRSLGDIPALSARMRLGFRKKWRLAPRALSCFMRRSFDLLFWNHT